MSQQDFQLFARVNINTLSNIKEIQVSNKAIKTENLKNGKIEYTFQFPITIVWEKPKGQTTIFYYKTEKAFEIAKVYIEKLYKELEEQANFYKEKTVR
jgi:hypothetical protein